MSEKDIQKDDLVGKTQAIRDHDHDMIDDLSKLSTPCGGTTRYIENANKFPEVQPVLAGEQGACVDRKLLGERTITLDCDVLQADGGTRTAAITGAYVALVDAVRWLQARREITRDPIFGAVAAVSVGVYRGVPVLDLDYAEDSDCDTDMNVVMNDGGGFIELQGTAEGHAFRRDELDALTGLAEAGIAELIVKQREALAG